MSDDLGRWLAEGLGAGTIVEVDGRLVDLAALAGRRHACLPALCTPGRRERGVLSCCADIEVPLSRPEQRAIERRLPLVTPVMAARDRRWKEGAPGPVLVDGALARPSRRCVFAFLDEEGLRCGLHVTADAHGLPLASLKPSSCRLFPLALVEVGPRTVLTASVGAVGRAFGSPPERALACIGLAGAPPLFVSCRPTIEELYGAPFYRRLAARARRWGALERSENLP